MPRVGKKILSTGNGRCNLTNVNAVPSSYNNPDFVTPVLEKYSPAVVVEFFESLGLKTFTDREGRVYPRSNAASSVLDALRFACQNDKTEVLCEYITESVKAQDDGFVINNDLFCSVLIISCGGKASPSQGSDGSGYVIAKSLGHFVTPVLPSLVPLNVLPEKVRALKGIRASNVKLTLFDEEGSETSAGEILFSDRSVSGIAAMELAAFAESSLREGNDPILSIDFLPEFEKEELNEYLRSISIIRANQPVDNMLSGILPKSLGISILKECNLYYGGALIDGFNDEMIASLTNMIKDYKINVYGTRGFQSAQVTKGGVDLSLVKSASLESKLKKGLYFCGEILDVDAKCGGFNLQWAFASGLASGELK